MFQDSRLASAPLQTLLIGIALTTITVVVAEAASKVFHQRMQAREFRRLRAPGLSDD